MNRHKPKHAYSHHRLLYILPIAFTIYLLLPPPPPPPSTTTTIRLSSSSDRCSGRYIYIHALPPRFNSDILRHCHTLSNWTNMCLSLSNSGLGPPLPSQPSFFSTDQFALDLIFHRRFSHYPCTTPNSSLASAVFVPFYAGLDVSRHLWTPNASLRDATALDLTRWLKSQPEWAKMQGQDHFLIAGRTTWDFRRLTDQDTDWGNKLLLLPEVRNMTVLVLESSPWDTIDVAIPYPTYFHPKDSNQMIDWQERMRKSERRWLFSFAGAARANGTTPAATIRDRVIKECKESSACRILECDGKKERGCHSPEQVMELFQSSVFCLQPPGDTYTRRSAFDAMVAGCVPVFFHPRSGYEQYVWHLGREYGRYSVMVEEEGARVEDVLRAFGEEEVSAMREEVIRMMPGLVYGDPREGVVGVRDAFDVALEAVLKRVRERKSAQ